MGCVDFSARLFDSGLYARVEESVGGGYAVAGEGVEVVVGGGAALGGWEAGGFCGVGDVVQGWVDGYCRSGDGFGAKRGFVIRRLLWVVRRVVIRGTRCEICILTRDKSRGSREIA